MIAVLNSQSTNNFLTKEVAEIYKSMKNKNLCEIMTGKSKHCFYEILKIVIKYIYDYNKY